MPSDIYFKLVAPKQYVSRIKLIVDGTEVWEQILEAKSDDPEGQIEEVEEILREFSNPLLIVHASRSPSLGDSPISITLTNSEKDMKNHKDTDEYEQLKAEEAAKREAAVYETLEDDIDELRSTIKAQAILLREMGLSGFNHFLERILTLEKLQCKYDAWDPEAEREQFADV